MRVAHPGYKRGKEMCDFESVVSSFLFGAGIYFANQRPSERVTFARAE
jgi:hypothetical protein